MPEFRKVRAGQPLKIKAETWNAVMDATVASRSGGQRANAATPLNQYAADVVLVKNVTGVSLDRFSVVKIDDVIILPTDDEDEFKSRIAFKVNTPDGAEEGRWCVLLEPLRAGDEDDEENGEIGRAVVSGAVVCKIDLGSAGDGFVDAAAGEYIPVSGASGAQILWVAGGVGTATATGEQWAVIKLGGGGSLPVGEYYGMVYGVVSQNEGGFFYTPIVSVPPGL